LMPGSNTCKARNPRFRGTSDFLVQSKRVHDSNILPPRD
jgi:hypothetical protein